MRAALWLMGLFAMAVAMALFAGNNQRSVTWFWSPYRVDMSLNLAIVLLFLGFALVYAALRALAALRACLICSHTSLSLPAMRISSGVPI